MHLRNSPWDGVNPVPKDLCRACMSTNCGNDCNFCTYDVIAVVEQDHKQQQAKAGENK